MVNILQEPVMATIKVVYKKNGQITTRTIKFDGNYKFNIDDGQDDGRRGKNKKAFEGDYEVKNGYVFKDGKIVKELNLPTQLANQLIGMSNVADSNIPNDESTDNRDDTYNSEDFAAMQKCSKGGLGEETFEKSWLFGPLKLTGTNWMSSDKIDYRVRGMVGDNTIDGFYNSKEKGYRTDSKSGTVSIWQQQ